MKSMSLLIAIFFCLSVTAQQPLDLRSKEILFRNVNLVTMVSDEVAPAMNVLVRNGKVAVISKSTIKTAAGAVVIDGGGKYLLPGLAEMHAHVPPNNDVESMKEVLLLFAVNGITSIRGMLGHPLHLTLRQQLQKGEITGPHLYTSGPSFNGNTVPTVAAAEARVKEQKAAGYDFLKIHPGITLENFNAVARTAKAEQIPFAGHVPYAVGVWRAIDAGYATIDHLDGFVESLIPGLDTIAENQAGLFATFIGYRADTSKIKLLVRALRNKNIGVVPTQALAERWLAPGTDPLQLAAAPEMQYMKPAVVADWVKTKQSLMSDPRYNASNVNRFIEIRRKIIYDCEKAGVLLLLGSDGPQVFNVPGFSVHHELKYLVDAGLTPFEAIRTGTVNVGKFYGNDLQGVIKVGSPADLVLLNGNPLKDINQTKNVEGVLIADRYLNKEFIGAALKSVARTSESGR